MKPYHLSVLASIAYALPGNWPRPGPGRTSRPAAQSVAYFLENNPQGSNIVSLQIAADGSLSNPSRIPTGGNGAFMGLVSAGPLRKLRSDVIDETTPPTEPPGSAAQVTFDPSSSALFATIKGNAGSVPPKLGSFAVWPVEDGAISHNDPVVTQISDIFMDFGFSFVGEDRIFLSDPSFGASILRVGEIFTIAEEVHVKIPDQVAVCWTQHWQDTLYGIDAGSNSLHTLDATTGALENPITVSGLGSSANVTGVFDSAVSDGFMYSLANTNGITVVNLGDKTQLQYLDLEDFGQRQHYQGMGTWPSWHQWPSWSSR